MFEERPTAALAGEAPPAFGGHQRMDDRGEAIPSGNPSPAGGITDPRALTILTTEHWNLLTARSLVYNEAFARSSMFLSFLSATLVVLGLISTATGFSDAFLVVASVVLALDLFVGLTTLGRTGAASLEDLRYLQGMNRLRHAYLEMVPGIEGYFITSQFDDYESVAAFYGPASAGAIRSMAHGFTTTPGMLGVICAAVGGGLGAAIALLVTHDPMIGGAAGILAFVALFGTITTIIVWQVGSFMRGMRVLFPAPPKDS